MRAVRVVILDPVVIILTLEADGMTCVVWWGDSVGLWGFLRSLCLLWTVGLGVFAVSKDFEDYGSLTGMRCAVVSRRSGIINFIGFFFEGAHEIKYIKTR